MLSATQDTASDRVDRADRGSLAGRLVGWWCGTTVTYVD